MTLRTCNNKNYKCLNDMGTEEYINYLHDTFVNMFFKEKIYFEGKRVIVSNERESDGKLERFWHVISRQSDYSDSEQRFPDSKRCNAIHFIKDIIEKCNSCDKILITKRIERNENKVYIWCTNKNIMIVLLDKKNIYRFITCFIVTGNKNIKKFKARYNEYKKNKND